MVFQRTALETREDRLVDSGRVLGGREDASAPGTAQGLVGGEGDDVAVGHRVGVNAAGNEPGDVGSVEHEQGSDLLGDLPKRSRFDDPGVGRGPRNDQLRVVGLRPVANFVHVDPLVAGRHAVGHEVVEAPAEVDWRAVGEVTTLVESHAQHRVTGLQHR